VVYVGSFECEWGIIEGSRIVGCDESSFEIHFRKIRVLPAKRSRPPLGLFGEERREFRFALG